MIKIFVYLEIQQRKEDALLRLFLIFVSLKFNILFYAVNMKNPIYLLIILSLLFSSCSKKPRFELINSNHTGIKFRNTIVETDSFHVMNFEYIYNGAGVGIVDLNNDGRQDIIFTASQVSPRVYLNEGDFKFTDISSSFKGLDNGQWYSGVTFVDINNDGWKDIYFTCTAYNISEKRKNRFYINQGLQDDGRLAFKEMAETYGIADDSYSVHAAFFDYDRDGDLDLYLMNNFVNDRLSASYRPKVNNGTAVSNDDLYRNNGDGTFSNVTIEAGIIYEGFGLGLALGDVNKDGYPDIYVSNDYISNDLLYINQGDGTFKNKIDKYMSYQTKSSMGNDMADINNDGYPDMFTLDMMPEYYYKKKQTINGFAYLYYLNDAKYGYEHQYLRNMLHQHNGFLNGEMIPYSEVGQMMGIYQTNWSWSPLFADYDNDGDKDLLITNGYPKDLTDKDWTKYKAEVWNFVASDQHLMNKAPAVKIGNNAFENVGDFKFIKRSQEWFDEVPSYSYGAAFADLDNDGDLDYVVNNLNDEAFIYKNTTIENAKENSNFIKVKLIGKENNTSAFGAKVEVWSGGNYQFQEHFLSRGYISSVDPNVHFGLGENILVDSIKVSWPSSAYVSYVKNIQANQLIEIDEKNSIASNEDLQNSINPEYMFSRVDSMINYTHKQTDFIDFYYIQKTIPHKFSQIGPRMQKGDLNNDGKDDIIIGATSLLPTRAFLRNGNKFTETEIEGLTNLKGSSESNFAIIDIDQDGDNDIIALAGGYGNREEKYIHYLYENNNGSFTRTELPLPPFPASVVRPFDFDHDGDMDLFIGARIKVGMFPFANDSWILINDKGQFNQKSTMNFNLGMVTDAVWSDYDGDGWEDLLIAREWNSVFIIKNLKGERLKSQELPEIESMHGIWYSITAGDFDQDGDDDYILGNLGENHRFTVSNQYPLRLYALDLDLNGTLDPIPTGYWKDQNDVMTEYPINYLDELCGQSAYFMERFNNYASFSYAPFEAVLDSAMMNRIEYTFYTNTTSSYILWNKEDKFEWEKLPLAAQVSPIKKMIVRDFNNDSFPDVILAGNDYTYDVSTGYFDANKGLILLSKDDQPLSDLKSPSQSGLLLQGMVESLLYFDGDTSIIVAGFNRDKVETFSFIR
ncbi:MAG: VCBS repeat-containing protein [Bacteroidales bacterium]|nr:VCBS repeat-containing protein [Bacteroidales bacterium]